MKYFQWFVNIEQNTFTFEIFQRKCQFYASIYSVAISIWNKYFLTFTSQDDRFKWNSFGTWSLVDVVKCENIWLMSHSCAPVDQPSSPKTPTLDLRTTQPSERLANG